MIKHVLCLQKHKFCLQNQYKLRNRKITEKYEAVITIWVQFSTFSSTNHVRYAN